MDTTPPSQNEASSRPSGLRRGLFAPGVVGLVVSPLKVAAGCGSAGALVGITGATAKGVNPYLSGFAVGTQWFTSGYTYQFTRTVVVRSWGGEERMRSVDKVAASAVAGSAAGTVAGWIHGPSKILPTMVLGGVLAAGGQAVLNRLGSKAKDEGSKQEWDWSRWTPLKKLSDDEYLHMLNEKLLKVEADIALIDDKIAELAKSNTERGNASPSK